MTPRRRTLRLTLKILLGYVAMCIAAFLCGFARQHDKNTKDEAQQITVRQYNDLYRRWPCATWICSRSH